MTQPISSRERVRLVFSHREADRIPCCDSYWPETLSQWREEGAPDEAGIRSRFDFDIVGAGWVNHQARVGFEEVIEESEEWVTRRDGNGAILRYWRNRSGTPEHVAFETDTPERWRALKRVLLDAPPASRMDLDGARRAMALAEREKRWFVWAGIEAFEAAKDVLGHEILCAAMAEDPEWARDVFDTETEVCLRCLELLESEGLRFDGAWIYGDIAYNHAPFCSPRMYRELVMGAHARQVAWFKDRGLPVIYHTDGDFRPLIPAMLEIGVDCFQPLEAKANLDVRDLKVQFGSRAAWMGNIDATILLTNDRERIESEVSSKISVAKAGGGYIYHSDHSVPPGVSWETYRFLMERVELHGRY